MASKKIQPAPPTAPLVVIDQTTKRRKPTLEGEPVELADGRTWTLARAGVAPILTELRDRLYDESALSQNVRMTDVLQVAWVCLLANYNLTDAELGGLLTGLTEVQEHNLATATMNAVFGPSKPLRTYTDWMLASLHANGLDPAKIPAPVIPDVLDQLVRTGRAVPESDWISSAVAAGKRRDLLERFEKNGIKAGQS